jgi:hypothetical protein
MKERIFSRWLGVAGALPLLSFVACDEGVGAASRPVLVIQEVVTFPAAQVGQVQEQSVRISNGGDGVLEVFSFDVDGPPGVFEVDGLEGLTLEPQEDSFLTFRYTAVTAEQVTGRLEIDSNGDAQSEDSDITVVRINSTEPLATLVVSPSPVDFGRVAAGTTGTRDVSLINLGNIPMSITEVFPLDPSGEFTVDAADLAELPFALAPNETWVVTVNYAPLNDNRDQTPMEVEYRVDGDNRPRKEEVILQANGAAPCIAVTHEEGFSFGPSLLNQTRTELFTITNCSTGDNAQDLDISSLGLLATAEQASAPSFGLANAPALPLLLPPAGFATFDVTYTPTTLDVSERAWLEIVSNDTVKSPLVIEITGIGSNNACPIATARCSVRGVDGLPSDAVEVDLLETIECTSDGTVDPDGGAIVSYTWTLVRPESSATSLDSTNGPTTSFFVDAAGEYTVSLNVLDGAGSEACSIPTVNIIAKPGEDIAVEMFWDTPGDSDQTDEGIGRGTDVDLHFLHVGRGCWNAIPWDCHWRNKQPEWGVPGTITDNPGLDLDDTDGAGPENVNLNNPETATYRVGAEYYDDHGYGPSNVTIRVYVFGSIVFERSRNMPTSKFFWEVADIEWPAGLVTYLDRTYPAISAAPCP